MGLIVFPPCIAGGLLLLSYLGTLLLLLLAQVTDLAH